MENQRELPRGFIQKLQVVNGFRASEIEPDSGDYKITAKDVTQLFIRSLPPELEEDSLRITDGMDLEKFITKMLRVKNLLETFQDRLCFDGHIRALKYLRDARDASEIKKPFKNERVSRAVEQSVQQSPKEIILEVLNNDYRALPSKTRAHRTQYDFDKARALELENIGLIITRREAEAKRLERERRIKEQGYAFRNQHDFDLDKQLRRKAHKENIFNILKEWFSATIYYTVRIKEIEYVDSQRKKKIYVYVKSPNNTNIRNLVEKIIKDHNRYIKIKIIDGSKRNNTEILISKVS